MDVSVHPQRGGQRVDDEAQSTSGSLRRKSTASRHKPASVVKKGIRSSPGEPRNLGCHRDVSSKSRVKVIPIDGGVLRRG